VRLLELLSDGKFHSGDELGAALGVSRAAVWKQVQKIQEDLGVNIFSVRGKGYKLPSALELLDADLIRRLVPEKAQPFVTELELCAAITSTNDYAMKKVSEGVGSGFVCLAEQQTAGRGRRGRKWVSPYGQNIYLSIVWQFDCGATALEGLSLAAGVAAAKALSKLGVENVSLKWPNDILIDQAKLGGILLEMTGDPAGQCQVVLGVGINMELSEVDVKEIGQPSVGIKSLNPEVLRNRVAAEVIGEIVVMMQEFTGKGFRGFSAEWAALDAYKDAGVVIKSGAQDKMGVARGVDDSGALILDTSQGQEKIRGGEVSLRVAQ